MLSTVASANSSEVSASAFEAPVGTPQVPASSSAVTTHFPNYESFLEVGEAETPVLGVDDIIKNYSVTLPFSIGDATFTKDCPMQVVDGRLVEIVPGIKGIFAYVRTVPPPPKLVRQNAVCM